MHKKEKSLLISLKKIKNFYEVVRKMSLGQNMQQEEKSFLLSCTIALIDEFNNDKRFKSYLEFAYFIILKYSTIYKDYRPLYDFSVNFGFYPIAKYIKECSLLSNNSITEFLVDVQMESFYSNKIIETYEQKIAHKNILNSNAKELSYIAPTSFGKSTIISEHIEKYIKTLEKIAIIVPTKSLLTQTYQMVKKMNINRKIIIHDDMYNNEERFIGIFTQERALRLLENSKIYFDILYVDEAHNLFNKDERNILLSRLIKKNKKRNINQKVIYLSPLISNSSNLKLESMQEIVEQRIEFNIKEPEFYEFKLNGEVFTYNRFLDEFYKISCYKDYLSYISKKSTSKSFIYLRSPRKIEQFANELYNKLEYVISSKKINSLIKDLKKYVHKDFYVIRLLEKGIVYLHGKLPDNIKEYLEYKYKEIYEIKFIIANSVILEGINLPINSLFILNTYDLSGKDLTNLIGRVNRLDNIFKDYTNNIDKLLPQIHFVNSSYNRKDSNMSSKLKLLRSSSFDDVLENPLLVNFDFDNLKISSKAKERKLLQFQAIVDTEAIIFENYEDDLHLLKQKIIEVGLDSIFSLTDDFLSEILKRFKRAKSLSEWPDVRIIDKIYEIFIKEIEDVIDFEVSRLDYIETRNYYDIFLISRREKSLKEKILSQYNYFRKRIEEGQSEFYIGESYGEIAKETNNYTGRKYEVYVDLSKKTHEQLINLAIVKIKLEEDFVSFKIHKFLQVMLYYDIISQEEYNITIYGTNSRKKLLLIKTGLSLNLISKLAKDGQLVNLFLDKNNNISYNQSFKDYKRTLDDFYKFELEKYM